MKNLEFHKRSIDNKCDRPNTVIKWRWGDRHLSIAGSRNPVAYNH
ncbi:hypothetical protein [Microcoleus sp. herbarium8]